MPNRTTDALFQLGKIAWQKAKAELQALYHP